MDRLVTMEPRIVTTLRRSRGFHLRMLEMFADASDAMTESLEAVEDLTHT